MLEKIEFLIFKLLKELSPSRFYDFSIEEMFGDASGRIYYRVLLKDVTYVFSMTANVSKTEFGRGDSFVDFLKIHSLFSNLGINVPKIFVKDVENRALLLEDLGNQSIYDIISFSMENKLLYVKKSLDFLIDFQKRIYVRTDFSSPADKRSFNKKLFNDEFFHFYEYVVQKRIYDKSFKNLWRKSTKYFSEITKELLFSPFLLSHRDFQSKNLMLVDVKVVLIDFQDALLAPFVYDLVALLRDSYVVLSEEELELMLDYYWENSSVAKELLTDKKAFLRIFFLQTIQRKMKDAGRFVFLNQVKNKDWFVPFIKPSLEYVNSALIKLDMMKLRSLYADFIPEFREGIK